MLTPKSYVYVVFILCVESSFFIYILQPVNLYKIISRMFQTANMYEIQFRWELYPRPCRGSLHCSPYIRARSGRRERRKRERLQLLISPQILSRVWACDTKLCFTRCNYTVGHKNVPLRWQQMLCHQACVFSNCCWEILLSVVWKKILYIPRYF